MKTYAGFFGRVPMMQHSLSSLVQWGEHHSIGDPILDAQDQEIFRFVGEIDDLWRLGASPRQLRSIADELLRVLETHFCDEERMLAGIGYPNLARHAAEHREILEDLASIRERMDAGDSLRSGYSGLRLSNFILGVTVGHVVNTDTDYCRYVVEAKARESTGCA